MISGLETLLEGRWVWDSWTIPAVLVWRLY